MWKLYYSSLSVLVLLLGVMSPPCHAQCSITACAEENTACLNAHESCADVEDFNSIEDTCDTSETSCSTCTDTCSTADTCGTEYTECNQRYKFARDFSDLAAYHTSCLNGNGGCAACMDLGEEGATTWQRGADAAETMQYQCSCAYYYAACVSPTRYTIENCEWCVQDCEAAARTALSFGYPDETSSSYYTACFAYYHYY